MEGSGVCFKEIMRTVFEMFSRRTGAEIMKKITVKQIARKVGVSPATVSRVMNGTAGVHEEKRRRILEVVKHSDGEIFKRRPPLSGKTIGILFLHPAELDSGSLARKLPVLMKKLPRNWNLLLLPENTEPRVLISRHLHGELSGLLLFGHSADAEMTAALNRIPHVWLNSYQGADHEVVLLGNEFAGRMAVRRFSERNFPDAKFFCVTMKSKNPAFGARIDGFRFELFVKGKKCRILEIKGTGAPVFYEDANNNHLEQWIQQAIEPVRFRSTDGIFLPEERLTALFCRVCSKLKLSVWPRIISCNHSPELLLGLYPRPESIDLAPDITAEHGMNELLRRVSGLPPLAEHVAAISQPQFVAGDKTDP